MSDNSTEQFELQHLGSAHDNSSPEKSVSNSDHRADADADEHDSNRAYPITSSEPSSPPATATTTTTAIGHDSKVQTPHTDQGDSQLFLCPGCSHVLELPYSGSELCFSCPQCESAFALEKTLNIPLSRLHATRDSASPPTPVMPKSKSFKYVVSNSSGGNGGGGNEEKHTIVPTVDLSSLAFPGAGSPSQPSSPLGDSPRRLSVLMASGTTAVESPRDGAPKRMSVLSASASASGSANDIGTEPSSQHYEPSVSIGTDSKQNPLSLTEAEERKAVYYDMIEKPDILDAAEFEALRTMFVENDPTFKGRIPCHVLRRALPKYLNGNTYQIALTFLNKVEYAHNEQYRIRFRAMLTEVEKKVRRIRAAKIRQMSTRMGMHRLDTLQVFYDDTTHIEYRTAGKCVRMWLDTKRWWSSANRIRSLIPFWNSVISKVESSHGANVASLLYFARWLFLVNLIVAGACLFILLPGMQDFTWSGSDTTSYRGLLFGDGMQDSWMFYGGYKNRYGRYKMDVAWVLVTGTVMFLGLLSVITHISSGNADLDPHFSFSHALFGGWDHNVSNLRQAKVHKLHANTQLDQLLAAYDNRQFAREVASYWTTLPRIFGISLSIFVITVYGSVVISLIQYENETLLSDVQTQWKFLLVPGIISVTKEIIGAILSWIVGFERHYDAATRFQHHFSRAFILRMMIVLILVFSVFDSDTEDERVAQYCKETEVGVLFYRVMLTDFVVEIVQLIVLPYARRGIYACYNCCCDTNDEVISLQAHTLDLVDTDGSQASYSDDTDQRWKREFNISGNLLHLVYRQAMLLSALSFAPSVSLGVLIVGLATFFITVYHIRVLSLRPRYPMGVARQNRFFRAAMIIVMIVVIVPYTFFLRRAVACGPHSFPVTIGGVTYNTIPLQNSLNPGSSLPNNTLSIVNNFLTYVDSAPDSVSVTVTYLSNVFILWLIAILFGSYVSILHKNENVLTSELESLTTRLKLEAREKQSIIDTFDIVMENSDERGHNLFVEWLDEIGRLGDLYGDTMVEHGVNNLIRLCKTPQEELRVLFGQRMKIAEADVDRLLRHVRRAQMQLITSK
jgi:hypothetical protein